MRNQWILGVLFTSYITASYANTETVNSLLKNYTSQGSNIANSHDGEQLWNKKFTGKTPYSERSCATCHTHNLKNEGEHIKTGKNIPAMSPTVNSESLNNIKNIKKWLKRNCKWTLGRECTAQEKSNLILFINQQ